MSMQVQKHKRLIQRECLVLHLPLASLLALMQRLCRLAKTLFFFCNGYYVRVLVAAIVGVC